MIIERNLSGKLAELTSLLCCRVRERGYRRALPSELIGPLSQQSAQAFPTLCYRTRFHYNQSLAVNLLMTFRMEQHKVARSVTAAV